MTIITSAKGVFSSVCPLQAPVESRRSNVPALLEVDPLQYLDQYIEWKHAEPITHWQTCKSTTDTEHWGCVKTTFFYIYKQNEVMWWMFFESKHDDVTVIDRLIGSREFPSPSHFLTNVWQLACWNLGEEEITDGASQQQQVLWIDKGAETSLGNKIDTLLQKWTFYDRVTY